MIYELCRAQLIWAENTIIEIAVQSVIRFSGLINVWLPLALDVA